MKEVLYVGRGYYSLSESAELFRIRYRKALHAIEAMHLLKAGYIPDAIVCEYELEGDHGICLFKMIRSLQHEEPVPFLLISDRNASGLIRKAQDAGIDDCFTAGNITAGKVAERLHALCDKNRNKSSLIFQAEKGLAYRMPVSKRLFDIVMASTALVMLSPLLLIVMLAIRIESRGKVYFTSKRVGRTVFDFYKFRSMRTGSEKELEKLAPEKNQYGTAKNAEEFQYDQPCPACSRLPEGQACSPVLYIDRHSICENAFHQQQRAIAGSKPVFIKISNDPRVTRVGRLIRNTSIDELPQLINVIKGDLSIVGNRPLPVYEAEKLTADSLSKRFLAPAGLTGLWQVELRGKGGRMSEEERLRLDNEYASFFTDGRYSFWFDIKIILRTIPALFQKASV